MFVFQDKYQIYKYEKYSREFCFGAPKSSLNQHNRLYMYVYLYLYLYMFVFQDNYQIYKYEKHSRKICYSAPKSSLNQQKNRLKPKKLLSTASKQRTVSLQLNHHLQDFSARLFGFSGHECSVVPVCIR